jgi:hypothetical protein
MGGDSVGVYVAHDSMGTPRYVGRAGCPTVLLRVS